MSDGGDGKDRYIVPGLERGLRLLGCFSRDCPAIGLGDLARTLDLPRSTVFRLARTLEAMHFLQRDEGGQTYRLGPSVLGLGFEYLATIELPEIARPALEKLRDETGASTHIAIRDRDEIVYVGRYPSRSALTSNIRLGSRLAAHASSMGRALLADLDDDALDELYGGRALDRFTDQTPTDLAALRALLRIDRRQGYVVSRSYYERGVVSVAAPVRDVSDRAVAAINVTAAAEAIAPAALEGDVKDRVCEAAETISAWLGSDRRRLGAAAE
jgi:DNA-binding IclR family transcriptional regulator